MSFFNTIFIQKKNNLQNKNKNENETLEKAEIRVQMQTPINNIKVTKEYKLLKLFIKKTLKNKIKLCLVSFPVNNLYRNFSDKRVQFQKSKKLFNYIANYYNITYKDFGGALSDDLFVDPDHLNKDGSIIFTNLLIKECFGESL